MRKFKLWKMSKLLNWRFPEGRYFFNCNKTEMKKSSKIFFCFRTASLGGSGLNIFDFFAAYVRLQRIFSIYKKMRSNLISHITTLSVWISEYLRFSENIRWISLHSTTKFFSVVLLWRKFSEFLLNFRDSRWFKLTVSGVFMSFIFMSISWEEAASLPWNYFKARNIFWKILLIWLFLSSTFFKEKF